MGEAGPGQESREGEGVRDRRQEAERTCRVAPQLNYKV